MEETADKILKEIIESYKYDIKKENLSEARFSLNARCQFRLRTVIYDIRLIIQELDDYYGEVPGNDIKSVKEKLEEYIKNCYEMLEEVEKEMIQTNSILKGIYKDYKRFNSIKNVEESYRQCSR